MSADGEIAACQGASGIFDGQQTHPGQNDNSEKNVEKTKKLRKVSFPNEEALVTQYFEPANPWHDVPSTTRSQLAAEYLEACRVHGTPPLDAVLEQIRELPENSIGGSARAPRLALADCALVGTAPADALEALLRKVQFRRVEIDHVELDDEGAEAIFDMLEYYESASAVCITGPRHYGIRGYQAASRMIKKSAELVELEISDSPLEAAHAAVMARALRPLACRLRSLCLQRAALSGESLLSLVIALKSNSSVRELRLGDNRLSGADAAQLGSLLRYNTRIQLLDLSNNQIQDAGVGHIADALVEQAAHTPPSSTASPLSPHSPHHVPLGGYDTRGLAFLVLWNNQLTWNCAQYLAKVLRSSQSLCVLNVGRNALGAETVRALTGGGAGGSGSVAGLLVSLGLQAARLGPDAARALGDLVRAETRLQRLDLRDNRLGAEGLQAICDAMKENTTLTQIDLDEPTECATSVSACARLTREIRALCRRNEPPAAAAAAAPERLLRKISLTCHTASLVKPGPTAEEERRTRLRSPAPSPAPSPAGSPVPAQSAAAAHSRFCVTRVTPERESSTDSSCSSPSTPTRPAPAPSPSRFKVIQVVEPPKIKIHPASQPRKPSSRFSVTRNYDATYNPTAPPSSAVARPDSSMSDPGVTSDGATGEDHTELASTPDSVKSDSEITVNRFSSLPVGGPPVNVARFIVSRPVDSVLYTHSRGTYPATVNIAEGSNYQLANVPQKVHNTRFSISKPLDYGIVTCVDRLKTEPKKVDDVSSDSLVTNITDPLNVEDIAANETKVSEEKDINKGVKDVENIGLNVDIKPQVVCTETVYIPLVNVSPKNEVRSTENAILGSKDSQNISDCNNLSIAQTPHRVFHVQPVTIPPKDNTDIIYEDNSLKAAEILNVTKIEPPSIEGTANPLENVNITKSILINVESSKKDTFEENTLPMTSDQIVENKFGIVQEVSELTPRVESAQKSKVTDEKTFKSKKDASKKLEVIEEVPIPVIIQKNDNILTGSETADILNKPSKGTENFEAQAVFDDIGSNVENLKSDINDTKSIISDVSSKSSNKSVVSVTSDVESCLGQTNIGKTEESDDKDRLKDIRLAKCASDAVTDHTVCDRDGDRYHDNKEELSHNEMVTQSGEDTVLKTETKLVKNNVEVSGTEIVHVDVAVSVKRETVCDVKDIAKVHCDQNVCNVNKISEFKDVDNVTACVEKGDGAVLKQIEAITEGLGNLIQEMHDLSCKTRRVKNDSTQTDNCNVDNFNVVPVSIARDNVILKKNKSESSLDSPDLEVSRLMKRKPDSAFCDSSSSLEISGSSMESLYAGENRARPIVIQEADECDTELYRRREHFSTESSVESTSEVTPVNILNMSMSSNESVSPIIFGGKKLHGSLSSLEASVSSLESTRHERVMVTSADSGIEYSLQNPSENKDDTSSNEGTLTHNSSLKETVKKDCLQETLTTSPKRTNSLLDVPALKSKGLDRMRKISWVAPSASFHVPKPEPDRVEMKLQSNLEKLLSLFQHPSSLFSRSQSDDEKKSASNTPPRKDSSLTSSFWSWGSSTERNEKDEKEDRDSLSEATDSTLSERVQVSFVDESFSKKLDSKTPSTDTDNTLSEFQSFPHSADANEAAEGTREDGGVDKVTDLTTDDNLVQKSLVLSVKSVDSASSNGNKVLPGACDNIDLIMPNDLNKNVYDASEAPACGANRNPERGAAAGLLDKLEVLEVKLDEKPTIEPVRPRTFAAVLKSSGSENTPERQASPDAGQPVDKLPSKVIRGLKENISPENTLISSMSNTRALAYELERQVKNPIVNAVWDVTSPLLEKTDAKEETRVHSDLAPIATIDETCDEAADNCIQLAYIDDVKIIDPIERNVVTEPEYSKGEKVLENVDLGKDALSYLIYENQDFEPDVENLVSGVNIERDSLAQELIDAEIKEQLDLSPELVIDDAQEMPEVFAMEIKGMMTSIPERAKKKSNSLEDLSKCEEEKDNPKTKTIAFKVPETTTPRDIPERRGKLRSRSGSSPKSLPESLNKPSPLSKMDAILTKKKKKVSSLGKMARDSLLALNMNEDEIAEFRRSYQLTSVESLRSLESVSEDANSQSGTSFDSRCRACLRLSQESLMSLDSITEDCRCLEDCDKRAGQSNR